MAFRSAVLYKLLPRYDATAILGVPRTFIMSTQQWRALLGVPASRPLERLLDVGAGNGDHTLLLQPLFRETVATEVSTLITWRLSWRGVAAVRTSNPASLRTEYGSFDVVSALNVLDRCVRAPIPWSR